MAEAISLGVLRSCFEKTTCMQGSSLTNKSQSAAEVSQVWHVRKTRSHRHFSPTDGLAILMPLCILGIIRVDELHKAKPAEAPGRTITYHGQCWHQISIFSRCMDYTGSGLHSMPVVKCMPYAPAPQMRTPMRGTHCQPLVWCSAWTDGVTLGILD